MAGGEGFGSFMEIGLAVFGVEGDVTVGVVVFWCFFTDLSLFRLFYVWVLSVIGCCCLLSGVIVTVLFEGVIVVNIFLESFFFEMII